MIFELTESLITDIIFAMEDQNSQFALDSASKSILPLDALTMEEFSEEENIIPLPDWSSRDGFMLLEDFSETVRIPKIRSELKEILANGRGVFRNFKDLLKKYPQIERKFHSFKEKKMRSHIYEWYNSLRDSWGLEKLSQDFEEYDQLTQEDFDFTEYNPKRDGDCIQQEAEEISNEIKGDFPGEAADAISQLWLKRFSNINASNLGGIVCHTLTEEFAGCLLYSRFPSIAENTAHITAFFVNQNYRGLGIARELFSHCISNLKEHGIHFLIIADSVPEFLEPLLTRCGFQKKGTVFIAKLAEKN